jgi:uncharacterized SAM-binding protein YcdF (DUF218 family)
VSEQRRRRVRVIALLVIVACVLGATTQAGRGLVLSTDLAEPDAILVMASHEWERIPEAAALAQQAPSARVLLTVPRVISTHNCHRCGERGDWLVMLGVDPSRLTVLPRGVDSTRDEARAALAYCTRHRLRKLLVVTSPYHARRTMATFRHVFDGSGVQVGVRPALAHSAAQPRRWWSTPYDRWYVFYEWSALGYYLMRYGIIPWP